jgi:hypothetical protein
MVIRADWHLPYLLHSAHSIHLVHLRSQTLDLDADVSALFNNLLSVVGPLRRCSVRVELDFSRNHLSVLVVGGGIQVWGIYTASHKGLQRSTVDEEPGAEY